VDHNAKKKSVDFNPLFYEFPGLKALIGRRAIPYPRAKARGYSFVF
jgi:hypothetical protein